MSLTFGKGLIGRRVAPSAFSPATLSLTGWWFDYAGSPWLGTVSAGTSGSGNNDLEEGTNPPSIGAALNGYDTANFDGTNDVLFGETGVTTTTYLDASAGSVAILFNADSAVAAAAAGAAYESPALFGGNTGGTYYGIHYDAAGVRVTLYDGAWKEVIVAALVGEWNLAQVKHDGVNLMLRVNSGAWFSVAAGAIGNLTAPMAIGPDYNSAAFFDGKVAEVIVSDTVFSDGTFDQIITYISSKYAIDLDDFSPVSLSLTGWWRANYTGSPWIPTATAGSSVSNGNLAEATNPPATGTAVNGLTPTDFDGVNDQLHNANAVSTFITTTAWSCWALVWVDTIAYAGATYYSGDPILTDHYSVECWGLHLSTNGGNKVIAYQWNGAAAGFAVSAISTGAWQLVQAKYDGTNIKCRVNSGAWASDTISALSDASAVLTLGGDTGPIYFDGKVLECATAQTALSDGTFDNVKTYVNARYGLAL
jgi:hypothetical protein